MPRTPRDPTTTYIANCTWDAVLGGSKASGVKGFLIGTPSTVMLFI